MSKEKAVEQLKQMGFYDKFEVVNCVPVWSNGRTIRRYQGQEKTKLTKDGGRKMLAILVEIDD